MRTGSSDMLFRGHRDGGRLDSRLMKARKSRLYRFDLEGLESRTLLATIPGATPTTSAPLNLSAAMGNGGGAQESSPIVAVDPLDPRKIVSVWVNNDTADIPAPGPQVFVEGNYSSNGGQSWTPFSSSVVLPDPNTNNPVLPYLQITNPSLSFDRSGNFYVMLDEHNGAGTSGAIVLEKYTFTGAAPVGVRFQQPFGGSAAYNIIYQWLPVGDIAFQPTMAVDSNIASFTDPTTGQVQSDSSSGDVYIAWATATVAPASPAPVPALFNPNVILMVASTDGGQNFSAPQLLNTSKYGPTSERDASPSITVSQGRLPNESGQQGDAGIPGGQVTVGWVDIAPNQQQLFANTIAPGRDFSFNGTTGFINFGATTDFPTTVQIPANQIGLLDSLTLTVDILDTSDATLGLRLIAPDGEFITLFTNQTIGGNTISVRGISGANVGENNGFLVGTTFTDSAARSIVDISPTGGRGAAAPYIGNFRVENDIFVADPNGRTLTAFLNKVLANGAINGAWKLEAIDTSTSAPSTAASVDFWTLNLSTGMKPDLDVQVSGTFGLVVGGSLTNTFPTASAASPLGISPGLVLASDNTLGTFSPYEGRIYAAFVGYVNITVAGVKNPTDDTDIFLTSSDDGGRTWSFPVQVNNDNGQTDGFSEANSVFQPNGDVVTGRPQFQPEIAVDPTTGTLVLSWRDARNDAARARVATYITTSIDGGQTFSPQVYANPSQTAVDAITGKTVILGPHPDNESGGNNKTDGLFGYGTQMGLAVYAGQIYPIWAGNFNQASVVNGAVQGPFLSIFYQPMVIAAGPRVVTSDMGPIPYAEAASGAVSFTVTFDRPIDPPSLGGYNTIPTFTPADVLVYYHDTANGDPVVPLQVTSVTPVAASGVGPDNQFGYTQFRITFNPTPAGANPTTHNYTGTYSYMILPDDGSGTAISSPIRSFVDSPIDQPVIGPVSSTNVPLPVPTSGTGGSGTIDDFTTSTITINNSNYINANVTGITVNLTLDHQNDGDLTITLTAPNGSSTTLYSNPGDNGQNFINTTFSDLATKSIFAGAAPYSNGPYQPVNPLASLNGSPVNGTYRLTIDDGVRNNTGELISWSIAVNSVASSFVPQSGAPLDQNANGTADENPLTTPFTGLVPGDVYAAPAPHPLTPITFGPNPLSIIQSPFDQKTLPLIVPGPHVLSTSVPGGSGRDNLLLNGTTSTLNLTFDRSMQVSTFTPGQVLSIMGPSGLITGPQYFPESSVDQTIPTAISTTPGTLLSTLTVPNSNGTFKVANLTLALNITSQNDSNLSAVLIAPNGTPIALFSNVGGTGQNFTSTVFDDAAQTSITQGNAPFTGSYQPAGKLSSLIGLDASGTWTLQVVNNSQSQSGILVSWSLNITPQITVKPLNAVAGAATEFQIGFPFQQLSGTYTIQLGSSIKDTFGEQLDTNRNAGLDVLRGQGQNSPTATVQYTATDLPKSIPSPPSQVMSSIVVPDDFLIQGDTTSSLISGMQVTVNISYPFDPNLTATLYYDMGTPSQVAVTLFTSVGTGPFNANFNNTVFDDNAATQIQSGAAPFSFTYTPQISLANFAGLDAKGTWTLVIQNVFPGRAVVGTLNGWSLSFQKPLPVSGLGEAGSDNFSTSFRIFTLGQTDALSSQEWTAVGPAPISGRSGRIGGLAIDPSDPSGNTVYVGGASGGIWKTTNFLTTSPNGPTYIPLTDFGPSSGINIGSIVVFPRNNDPNQSLIIAATGEGDTGTPGVGFLISQNGGMTWNLYDSTNNVDSNGNLLPIDSALRDRKFVNSTSFKVVVDPRLNTVGQVIIYAAMSGTNGGIWRSEDTGKTWQLMMGGQATDVVLDPNSAVPLSTDTNTTGKGNLQVVYAAIHGQGVYLSPNQGVAWNLMAGVAGNPLIDDLRTGKNVNPVAGPTPNGAQGRIVLAVPAATNNAAENATYAGWLYAAVANPAGGFFGLFITKDFGQNWTEVHIPTLPPLTSGGSSFNQAIPTNDITQPNYNILGGGGGFAAQGNYDITLAVDPTNPNITYLGGDHSNGDTGLIRVDATNLWDAHSLVAYSNFAKDGGTVDLNSTGPAAVGSNTLTPAAPSAFVITPSFTFDSTSYLNFIRSPYSPFVDNATLNVFNYASFTNNGAGVTWIPFDMSGTDYHRVVTMIDPTTGLSRLIFGNDQGVWSVLDSGGSFVTGIGSNILTADTVPDLNRNGNLQITQFYYGAAQPSNAAAQVAGALFYGSAQDNGGPVSSPNVVTNGNIRWAGPGGDATGVGTNQQGTGTAYQYFWPCCGGGNTDFFQYIGPGVSGSGNYSGRTSGLLQQSNGLPTPDPQWPFTGGANFAINSVNGNDVVISSGTGNIFATQNQGETWFNIGAPSVFSNPGSFSIALAYGAPDPNAPSGLGNLGNFIYVGTAKGQIYITQVGGGTQGSNNWLNVSLGLDGSQIQSIITNPARGSHEAYAVTQQGVYLIADSIPSASNPTPTWVNITGNIHDLPYTIYGQSYNPTTDPNATTYNQPLSLTSIVADWRYAIPNNPTKPSAGSHPVLYVGANSGVYISTDNGQTWNLFPDTTYGAVVQGGYLPHVTVTSLSLSIGNIDVNTGMPNLAGPYDPTKPTSAADPDVLMASAFGRGEFAINIGPIILSGTGKLDPNSVSGSAADGTPLVTISQPVFDGLSQITNFGNATRITIVDETPTDSTFGQVIGGFDPSNVAGTNIAANWTNSLGNFSIPVNAGAFTSNGLKTVKIYATDDAGSSGNSVTIQFTLAVTGISAPSAPTTPTLELAPYDVTGAPGYTNIATPNLIGVTTPGATVELLQANGTSFSPQVITTSDPVTGTFTLTFPNPMKLSGTFTVEAVASNSNGTSPGKGSATFTIIIAKPSAPGNFSLDPKDDTGIKGDNITEVRQPHFIGTTEANATVELFQVGKNTIWATTTADQNGHFSVQLPFSLTNGQISLYVEVVDLAGNASSPSNILPIMIVSVASDYNGDGISDPALFSRTTTNQLQWLVQSTVLPPATTAPPPWFVQPVIFTGTLRSGSASVTGISSTAELVAGQTVTGNGVLSGTTIQTVNSSNAITLSTNVTVSGSQSLSASTPANVIPFQGDFDGDGLTDLAYYQPSNATWYTVDSLRGTSFYTLGTANSSVPVVGYFDANGPDEMAVFTIVNGQGVWSIASGTTPRIVTFGQAGDIPEPGNYDGLGYDQVAIYRPTTGQFLVLEPNGTIETLNLGVGSSADLSSLVPVAGAYDNQVYFSNNQSQRTEAAVYDPNTGVFTILGPSSIYTVSGFLKGDIPAPADYLGNGSIQPVVFRPSTGQFIRAGGTIVATFGQSGDIPLAAPLSYRLASFQPAGQTATGSTGTGSTGTGSTGTGSSSSSSTFTSPAAQNPGSSLTHPGTSTHKKTVAKHKPKPLVHHKKPAAHKKIKAVQNHAAKPKVHVVMHNVTKAITASSSAKPLSRTHVVDLALQDIHVNLRRSSSAIKHHG